MLKLMHLCYYGTQNFKQLRQRISLLIPNNVIANYPFKLTENPRKVLLLHQSDQYKKPEDAPFWMLDWKQSLEIQLLKLVIEFMGYPSFIGLLEQKNYSFPTSDPRDSYYTNICNLSNLSLNEKKGIAQSLRYILEHKENCDWNFVVFLLGELKDERAVKPIMESENWDSDRYSDRDTIEEKIAQKAIEKITKKKSKPLMI